MQKKHMIISGVAIGLLIILMIVKTITGSSGKIESIADVIDAGSTLNAGEYTLTINNSEENETGTVSYPIFKITGQTDGTKHILSLILDNNNDVIETKEVVYITNESIYVNTHKLSSFFSNVFNIQTENINTSDGEWLSITNGFTEENKLTYTDLFNLFGLIVKSGTADIEQTKDNTFFTINVTDKDTITKIYNNIATMIDENRETLSSTLNKCFSPININCKTAFYQKLANTSEMLTETEYVNKIIDNLKNSFDAMALNSSSTTEEQLVSCSVSYNSTEDNLDTFSENIIIKQVKDKITKNYNISFTFEENQKLNLADIDANKIASQENLKGIDELLDNLLKYNFTELLDLDFSEEDTIEFDVLVKDNLIVCSDINETYTRKVMYLTKNDKIEEIVVAILTNNSIVNTAFSDYYTGAGYTQKTIASSAKESNLTEINETITEEINATLAINAAENPCTIYVATSATLKTFNESITTIDNFILSIKG